MSRQWRRRRRKRKQLPAEASDQPDTGDGGAQTIVREETQGTEDVGEEVSIAAGSRAV